MFDRPHHRRIARLLGSLDAGLLDEHGCLFGGGTAIALRFGEYRESVDVDFLVSRLEGYRELRQRLSGPAGIGVILKPGEHLAQLREVRVDQYGVRTL
ncbi:MAG: nucleotidyl transferase AbiEii/AbiGii toxin family protein, partial [Rubrivivax sp.]